MLFLLVEVSVMSQSRLFRFILSRHGRFTTIVICLLVGSATVGRAEDEAAVSAVGLVAEAPASDFAVSTELGHMVAYQQKIPGSDVLFEMSDATNASITLSAPDLGWRQIKTETEKDQQESKEFMFD